MLWHLMIGDPLNNSTVLCQDRYDPFWVKVTHEFVFGENAREMIAEKDLEALLYGGRGKRMSKIVAMHDIPPGFNSLYALHEEFLQLLHVL